MIILLRGHIRNSFNTEYLYELIQYLSNNYNIEIYIHTWDIIQNNISWREIKEKNIPVTNEMIYDYFKDLKHLIKHIIIDSDKDLKLFGNTKGLVYKAPCLGWKNMWYGKFRIIKYLFENSHSFKSKPPIDQLVVNLRFDIFSNSQVFESINIIKFINNIAYYTSLNNHLLRKNIFIKNIPTCYGIDNIYIGNINTMHKLIGHFHFNLDKIMLRYKYNRKIRVQEALVFLENKRLFS
jgi:hypothetical protein